MDVVISSSLTPQSLSSTPETNQAESDPAKSVENETGVQGVTSDAVLSSKYDTLEFSQDYLNYKTQNKNSTLEETVYSNELYSYSDSELKTLVSDGTITRAQYNTEMAKRQSNSIEE